MLSAIMSGFTVWPRRPRLVGGGEQPDLLDGALRAVLMEVHLGPHKLLVQTDTQ